MGSDRLWVPFWENEKEMELESAMVAKLYKYTQNH